MLINNEVEVITIAGQIRYMEESVQLIESDGRISTLAVDKPPLHHFNLEDIAAAMQFYRDLLGAPDGSNTTLLGIRERIGLRELILIVRVLTVG